MGIYIAGVCFESQDYVTAWNDVPDADLERFIVRWESKEVIVVATAVQDWIKASENAHTGSVANQPWLRRMLPSHGTRAQIQALMKLGEQHKLVATAGVIFWPLSVWCGEVRPPVSIGLETPHGAVVGFLCRV